MQNAVGLQNSKLEENVEQVVGDKIDILKQQHSDPHGAGERSRRAFPGFLGADVRGQRMAPQHAADIVGQNIS